MMVRSATAVAILAVLVGCGEERQLDANTAQDVVVEAELAASRTYSLFAAELGKLDGPWVSGTAASFTVDGTMNGTQGGSVQVSGGGSMSGTTYTFDVTMTFAAYKGTSELVLDGELALTYEVTNVIGGQRIVTLGGDLAVSGAASGNASMNVKVTYEGPGKYSVCGTVNDAKVAIGSCPSSG
jgi:hypothetical protein